MDVAVLRNYSIFFMIVLLVWAVGWLVVSRIKIQKNVPLKIAWQIHFYWNVINFIIATLTLYSLALNTEYSYEKAMSQVKIVIINIGLDAVYLLVAYWLCRHTKPLLRMAAAPVAIQASFLFMFDVIIVAVFMLHL